MKKITVYCELINNLITDASLELISKACELKAQADKLKSLPCQIEAVVIAPYLDENNRIKMFNSGADRVVLIKEQLSVTFCQTTFSKTFIDYFNQNTADVILFPATEKTRTLAPRITTMLKTGLVADCTDLEFILKNDEVKLVSTRPTFGGELMAAILSKQTPECATIRPNTFQIKQVENPKNEYFEYNSISYEENRLKLLRTLIDNSVKKDDLASADIVLAGGFGLVSKEKNEYFDKLKRLAKKLNASTASTRKVVDYGIMPLSSQVGQTGITIKPKLYIAFGISGAIQHIMGMKNSKTIVAINTDSDAEIFKYADYKVVADAKKVIDELLETVI